MPSVLTIYRRHTSKCPHKAKGRRYIKCECPIWIQGTADREPVRASLDTRSWAAAQAKLAVFEHEGGPTPKLIADACAAFLQQAEVKDSTARKNKRRLRLLCEYSDRHKLPCVADWNLEALDGYRGWRRESLEALAWTKELQFLRQFFRWCQARGWTDDNPAAHMKPPRAASARQRTPYTAEEVTAIIAACDRIGQSAYERLRARAAVLLARRYGLRVSDIACLRRDAIQGNSVRIRAIKNGEYLSLRLYPEVREALDRVPVPAGGQPDGEYYFWTGRGTQMGHVNTFGQTLASVYRLSGVPNAHTHRFRHTLASELLAAGATIEDVALMLGDAPNTIRQHYAHLIPARQTRLMALLDEVHDKYRADRDGRNALITEGLSVAPGDKVEPLSLNEKPIKH
jgi:site-specific recombinase XerD